MTEAERGTVRWDRDKVLRGILSYERSRRPMNSQTVQKAAPALYAAARRHFGAWKHALQSAGIKPDEVAKKREWDGQSLTHHIRDLFRRGRSLKPSAVVKREGGFYNAAVSLYGSWPNALIAAGINPDRVCDVQVWDRDRIIEAILIRVVRGEALGRSTVRPSTLKAAAIEEFGSWTAALESAGLEPKEYIGRPHPNAAQHLS